MKKIIALLSLCAAILFCFVACDKEDNENTTERPAETEQFDPFAAIQLHVKENNAKDGHYTAEEIYRYAYTINYCEKGWHSFIGTFGGEYYTFRDTVAKVMAIKGEYAISTTVQNSLGKFVKEFNDIVFTFGFNEDGSIFDHKFYADSIPWIFDWNSDEEYLEKIGQMDAAIEKYGFLPKRDYALSHLDTVGYIPNAIMDSMRPLVQTAFDNQDWNRFYDLIKNGYKVIPITGEEYMELVRQGIN